MFAFFITRRRMKELFGLDDGQTMRSEGKTETKVNMGECDAFTDIGATLKASGEIIVAELFTSNPQLVANREATQGRVKLEKMEDSRICIGAVLQVECEPVHMVLMDVAIKILAAVEEMLPSVVSPTGSPAIDVK